MAYTLGQLARETGLNVETVRFYERKQLLGQTNRAASGYRQYGRDALTRLRFIRQAKTLGFTLREIGELLELRVHPESSCEQVHEAASAKLKTIESKIQELQRIRKALRRLTAMCSGERTIEECSIVGELEAGLNGLNGMENADHKASGKVDDE